MSIKKLAIKKACSYLGIDEEMTVPEIVETAGELLGIDIEFSDVNLTPVDLSKAMFGLTSAVEGTMKSDRDPAAKVYLLAAAPEGKPKFRALVVLG